MRRHEVSVVVKRPIEEVWAWTTDPFHVMRFGRRTVLGFRWTSPGPPGLGSTFQMRVSILGLEGRMTGVITEGAEPHFFAWSAKGMGFRSISFRQTLEATAKATKVVRVSEIEPGWALTLIWWILGPLLRSRMDASAQNIKRLLEGGRG